MHNQTSAPPIMKHRPAKSIEDQRSQLCIMNYELWIIYAPFSRHIHFNACIAHCSTTRICVSLLFREIGIGWGSHPWPRSAVLPGYTSRRRYRRRYNKRFLLPYHPYCAGNRWLHASGDLRAASNTYRHISIPTVHRHPFPPHTRTVRFTMA